MKPDTTPAIAVRAALLAVLAAASCCATSSASKRRPIADAPPAAKISRRADAPTSGARSPAQPSVAPNGPPLTVAGTSPAGASGGDAQAGDAPRGEPDPLVSNGLGSPLCKGALDGAELSGQGRRNCETSGFVATAAPTGDFGLDVHIDAGVLGVSLDAAVEELLITPLWMALVWAVHALIVMLEWCFTIDLLDSASVGDGLARGLRQMQSAFTEPWLAIVLAVASTLALYNGLIRRRVAETVGQALLALAMMAGGLWVMVDPTGTVGALGGWANQASLGTLAVTASGTPGRAGRTLVDGMGTVFATAVEVPWCYLEFGDVGWCRNPSRLDAGLRAAGLAIATGELGLVGCKLNNSSLSVCAARGSAEAKTLEYSARLLRTARTNGAIFLALPANGPARNAINDPGSLLRAICQAEDATSCRGPTSAEAEFRTQRGTSPRIGGLLLITAGVLGMLLLLGFVALRLLASALLSLLYLMLAPAAVLAPALGDGGRAVFRKWAAQLLGAVISKLLFSFLLGVILAVLAILANLEALGWWTQWLLMSAFWWGAFARRHQALQIAGGALGNDRLRGRLSLARRVRDALDPPRRAIGGARAVKERLSIRAPDVEPGETAARVAPTRARTASDDQATRTLEADQREARAHLVAAPALQTRLSAMHAQLERVRRHQGPALAAADSRRAARLAIRAERLEDEIAREQLGLNSARRVASDGERARGREVGTAERREERTRFLDAQAALPAAAMASGLAASARRDYSALAGLAGYGPREYERLDPQGRRAARVKIDRELASRKELRAAAGETAARGRESTPSGGETRKPSGALDRRLEDRMRDREPVMARGRARPARGGHESRAARLRPARVSESIVMRDAREVAARRKRQLGPDRP